MARSALQVRDSILTVRQGDQAWSLPVGSAAWYAWLVDATAFAFAGPEGTFTARKERVSNGRGGWYWRAYRRRDGTLYRFYLGRSEELSRARLQAAAEALAASSRAGPASRAGDRPNIASGKLSPSPIAGAVPTTLTSCIGREREVAEISALLATTRLLTLTGTGGVGKTRLAQSVAVPVAVASSYGVRWVDLASLADPHLVPQTVAIALGVREVPGEPILTTVLAALHTGRLLLVLDNCEHLTEGVARLVDHLLRVCPGVQILATSREALGMAGETAWRVPSLRLPASDDVSSIEELGRVEAVALFVARAAAALPGFCLTGQNAAAVAQICRRLDGIPLALELAAARVRVLAVEQIAARLDDRFQLLTTGNWTAWPRHRTLRALVDWSFALLSEREQALFCWLAVFAGGWTLEAAEAVGKGDGIAVVEVVDLLARLVDKSLVMAETSDSATMRYRLLETLRQYGWERLAERDEVVAARDRHGSYFLALAERLAPRLEAHDLAAWLDYLERERDNLRAALRWMWERRDTGRGLRLAVALRHFWQLRGPLAEGRAWLEDLLVLDAPPASAGALALRAAACDTAGFLARFQGDYAAARVHINAGLTLRRRLGDRQAIADALSNLGSINLAEGDFDGARVLYEESLATNRAAANRQGVADGLSHLGSIAFYQGDLAMAQARHAESLALWRETGDRQGVAWAGCRLGDVAMARGDLALAGAYLHESLTLRRAIGDQWGMIESLQGCAMLAAATGQSARSLCLAGAAATRGAAVGITTSPVRQAQIEQWLRTARAAVGDDAATTAWQQGEAMPIEEAIAAALVEDSARSDRPAATGVAAAEPATPRLTRREREVVQCLARGLSNRAIATELSISERTVERHVENLLGKLDLHSRAQVVAWVAEHSLLAGQPAE